MAEASVTWKLTAGFGGASEKKAKGAAEKMLLSMIRNEGRDRCDSAKGTGNKG